MIWYYLITGVIIGVLTSRLVKAHRKIRKMETAHKAEIKNITDAAIDKIIILQKKRHEEKVAWEQGAADLEEVYEQQYLSLQDTISSLTAALNITTEELREAQAVKNQHEHWCLPSYSPFDA